jgi:hypothetical protein
LPNRLTMPRADTMGSSAALIGPTSRTTPRTTRPASAPGRCP